MTDKVKRILCIAGGLIGGAWLTYSGGNEFLNSHRLAAHGTSVTAQVEAMRDRVGRRRSHTYYLTVGFQTAQGQPIRHEVKVSRETFDRAQIGGRIKAHYLPENPTLCAAGETVDLRYGTLLLGLAALAGAAFLWLTMNRPSTVEVLAEKIEGHLQPLLIEKFQYATVHGRDFGHLDLDFYAGAQKFLEANGYTFLTDQENLTVTNPMFERTFVRVLTSADQATVAFLYQLKLKNSCRPDSEVMDLESQFSNGQFLCTSNASQAGAFDPPPGVRAKHLPAPTAWDQILKAHQEQVADFLSSNPGVEAARMSCFADVRRFQDELQRTKAEYRRKVGMSKTELERLIGGRPGIDIEALHTALAQRLQGHPAAHAHA